MENFTDPGIIKRVEKFETIGIRGDLKEVKYRLYVNKHQDYIPMKASDLLSRIRFQRKFLKGTGIFPVLPKGEAYRDWINMVMESVVIFRMKENSHDFRN